VLFSELIDVLDPEPHSAPLNMAIDEALLHQVKQPTLRIYQWREPAVSFGYFGPVAEAERVAAGRVVVRRWTGGGIVEHGEDVTYTLIVPREHAFFQHGAPESYRLIHEAIGELLASEGVRAEVVPVVDSRGGGECFSSPVQYDLVAGGKKIAGAAQRRTRWGLLHQGSIRANVPLVGFAGTIAAVLGAKVSRRAVPDEVRRDAEVLAVSKYATNDWLRRH